MENKRGKKIGVYASDVDGRTRTETGELTDGVARILAFLSWRSLSSRTDNSSIGGALGLGGALKPGMGGILLDFIGDGGLLRGYAVCMCVAM